MNATVRLFLYEFWVIIQIQGDYDYDIQNTFNTNI
jgi:hypothetical protein